MGEAKFACTSKFTRCSLFCIIFKISYSLGFFFSQVSSPIILLGVLVCPGRKLNRESVRNAATITRAKMQPLWAPHHGMGDRRLRRTSILVFLCEVVPCCLFQNISKYIFFFSVLNCLHKSWKVLERSILHPQPKWI